MIPKCLVTWREYSTKLHTNYSPKHVLSLGENRFSTVNCYRTPILFVSRFHLFPHCFLSDARCTWARFLSVFAFTLFETMFLTVGSRFWRISFNRARHPPSRQKYPTTFVLFGKRYTLSVRQRCTYQNKDKHRKWFYILEFRLSLS